jgi:uncharacterized protein (DUF362 family)
MSQSLTASGNYRFPEKAMHAGPHDAVAILRCDDHANLAGVLARLRSVAPSLLPTSLPAKVVIKPNLCDVVSWEAGVTTDPGWLPVLATELRAIRPDVQILVVESDAVSAYKTSRSCDETYDRLGYREIAREHGIELVNLSKSESIEISLEGIPLPILVSDLFLEEFYFISIANLKVHAYERMTGILKNSLGLLTDSDISALHPYLSLLISRLHRLCPPDLCIVDGRIGLEGHGPIMGDPVRMNSIIFSKDALAADVAACQLMMISPEEVPHLRRVAKDLGRKLPKISVPRDIEPRAFAFNSPGHRAILLKFANRRFHRSSELFTNRWINRFLRFKDEPLKFATEAIPKLARRFHAR